MSGLLSSHEMESRAGASFELSRKVSKINLPYCQWRLQHPKRKNIDFTMCLLAHLVHSSLVSPMPRSIKCEREIVPRSHKKQDSQAHYRYRLTKTEIHF